MPMPSDPAVLHAGCKVNIYLRITGVRDDGYHLLESLFLPLADPHDTLTVTLLPESGLRFECSDPALGTGSNIVAKAYAAFARAAGFAPGMRVFLQKNIPYGAGLGGGSADAAALLAYCNALAEKSGKALVAEELHGLAASLGADVPFFLLNEPATVRGIGDVITPEDSVFKGMHMVLVCPAVHVATAWAFAAWDEKNAASIRAENLTKEHGEDTSPLVRGVCIRNDLTGVVFSKYPELEKIAIRLYELEADAASMSGSGSSIFGLFENAATADSAFRFFRDKGFRVFHHVL